MTDPETMHDLRETIARQLFAGESVWALMSESQRENRRKHADLIVRDIWNEAIKESEEQEQAVFLINDPSKTDNGITDKSMTDAERFVHLERAIEDAIMFLLTQSSRVSDENIAEEMRIAAGLLRDELDFATNWSAATTWSRESQ